MSKPRLTRSYLAVPAHRERLVRNAAASAADAVFLDLEDAVPPAEKVSRHGRLALRPVQPAWSCSTTRRPPPSPACGSSSKNSSPPHRATRQRINQGWPIYSRLPTAPAGAETQRATADRRRR